MNKHLIKTALLAGAIIATLAAPAQAQVRITEVTAFGSGSTSFGADWFEVTNFGSSAVNIAGWKMDDNSNSFGSAVALAGISIVAAGESVIFVETTSLATAPAAFLTFWFGANSPASLQVGSYSGSGVGLSQSSDAVNLFNSAGLLQANVSFGASDAASIKTFDNAAGLNNTTISQLSATGVNGAFVSANAQHEIGSPGVVASVPEPEGYALALAGLAVVGVTARRRGAVKA